MKGKKGYREIKRDDSQVGEFAIMQSPEKLNKNTKERVNRLILTELTKLTLFQN